MKDYKICLVFLLTTKSILEKYSIGEIQKNNPRAWRKSFSPFIPLQ